MVDLKRNEYFHIIAILVFILSSIYGVLATAQFILHIEKSFFGDYSNMPVVVLGGYGIAALIMLVLLRSDGK
jgi:hypothetical protein